MPTLNLSGTCRALDRKDFDRDRPARCLKSENEARAKLAEDWAKYSAADRSLYPDRPDGRALVQLLTCLELRQDLVAGAQGKPATGSPMRTSPTGLPAQ